MKTIKWLFLSLLCFTFTSEIQASGEAPPIVITEIPSTGLIISSPGTYLFGNNITWSPSGDGQAILILSRNVIIDMQNHTLASDSNAFVTTGIVAALSENLTIKNGTIKNMTYRGIECEACGNIRIKHIIVDGLSIDNTAVYTVPVGILVTASKVANVYKCTVKNINVKTGSCAAIQMTATTYSSIIDCNISNLLNRDGACTGIGHFLCDQAEITSCTLNGLKSEFIDNLNTEGHTAIGIIPFITTNLSVYNCKVSNVTGCCDDAHGISIFECTNSTVKKCKVNNVLDGAGPAQTGAKATGIEVYGSGVKVIKCSVKNIAAIRPQDRQATGFSCAQGSNNKFKKCHAEQVTVYNENGVPDTTYGFGTGFGWAPDPRIIEPAVNILYKDCTAERCQLGFDTWFHIDSVWDNITTKCNGIDILNLGDTAQRTLSCDACSECGCTFPGCYPDPFFITITNVARNNLFLNVTTKDCH